MFICEAAERGQDDGEDSVDVIADAIRSKYGDDALSIAEKQLSSAAVESADVWLKVVNRLRG